MKVKRLVHESEEIRQSMSSTRKRILIVEDDFLMREFLKFKLTRRGFDVTTAKNEKEFWNQAFKDGPHLILLDLWLANKIGADVYDRLIDFGFSAKIPVIFMTGHIHMGTPRPIRVKNNQIFLSKPFDFDQLAISIDCLLNSKSEQDLSRDEEAIQAGYRLMASERGGDFNKSVYLRR